MHTTALSGSVMHERLTIGDICSRKVTIADRKTDLVTAAQLMRRDHVGALVVVDDQKGLTKVDGVITDRDIVTSIIAQGLDPGPLYVEDVMSTPVVTVQEDGSLIDLMRAMRRNGVRRIPVTDKDHTLIGIVTLEDVLKILAEELNLLASSIDNGMKREFKRRP
jgi:CBS domain-containing protein